MNVEGFDLDLEIHNLVDIYIPELRDDEFHVDNLFYTDINEREMYWEVSWEIIEELSQIPEDSWTEEQKTLLTDSVFTLFEYRRLAALVRVSV